jgi:hypothetical protein
MGNKSTKTDENLLKITAQLSGFRSMAGGGWRLSMDLFESRPVDIASVSLLVNKSMTVKVAIQPQEEE